jgi:hypothetical protein
MVMSRSIRKRETVLEIFLCACRYGLEKLTTHAPPLPSKYPVIAYVSPVTLTLESVLIEHCAILCEPCRK